jgi:LCP family protein required for cell wall assembly
VRVRRLLAAAAAALGLVVAMVWGGLALIRNRIDNAVSHANLLGTARATPGALRGPLNILLVGSNWRDWAPGMGERADSIMIVHVPADRSRAYLISVPRDLEFTIKPYEPTGFQGSTEKIDAALNYGGMPLMAQTMTDLTGLKFNAAIESRFDGFEQAVTTLGGVNMCVDEKTISIHVGHDATGKFATPYAETADGPQPVPGVTPEVYYPGCQHLAAWQALDYVRQRELLPGGDYDRQRHQQQLIMSVLKQTASTSMLTDPVKLDRVIHQIGRAVTVDTNGVSISDFILTLRGIKAESLVGLKTPSHSELIGDTWYVLGDPGMPQLWQAIADDTVAGYAEANPDQVNALHPSGTSPASGP